LIVKDTRSAKRILVVAVKMRKIMVSRKCVSGTDGGVGKLFGLTVEEERTLSGGVELLRL
jgi:hypothetical protein